jgi:toxin-antitoxin system PIN domain toxin
MKVIDLDVLVYAINGDAPEHVAVRPWWENALNGEEPIALPWIVVIGFLRLVTHRGVFDSPLTPSQAVQRVDRWLAVEHVSLLPESSDHWANLRDVLESTGSSGNLVNDAHLATLAMARAATLVSCDTDFARLRGLRWENPLTDSQTRPRRPAR